MKKILKHGKVKGRESQKILQGAKIKYNLYTNIFG
jgi:hypothetical protein